MQADRISQLVSVTEENRHRYTLKIMLHQEDTAVLQMMIVVIVQMVYSYLHAAT